MEGLFIRINDDTMYVPFYLQGSNWWCDQRGNLYTHSGGHVLGSVFTQGGSKCLIKW